MNEPFFESQQTIKMSNQKDQRMREDLHSQDAEIMELEKQIKEQEIKIDDAPSDDEDEHSSDSHQDHDLKDDLAQLEEQTNKLQAQKIEQVELIDSQMKQISQDHENNKQNHQATHQRLKSDIEQVQQNMLKSASSTVDKVIGKNNHDSFQTRLDQDPLTNLRSGTHGLQDLKGHFLKKIEEKQEEIDKVQRQLDQEQQKCDEIQAKVDANIADRQKISQSNQEEIDQLESEIKVETEVQTSKQKTVQKLKSVISGHKDQIKTVTTQRLETVSDAKWKGNIMVGLFILVVGYIFPKFLEAHYGQIQWLVDHLWKIWKNSNTSA